MHNVKIVIEQKVDNLNKKLPKRILKMFFKKEPKTKIEFALQKQNKAFFWNPDSGVPNIGDYLAYETVNFTLNLHDKDPAEIKSGKLMSIGSVLHFAKTGDTVWGTGRNGKVDENQNKFSNLDVRAVRGPLTREFLLSKNIVVPEVYGDPGILAPLIYPESILCPNGPSEEYLVIPHLNDDMNKYTKYQDKLISPKQMPSAFIRQLLRAQKIISSSLHGIILAEAYGREAVFLESGSGETLFKYEDYYKGTGRGEFGKSDSVENCLQLRNEGIQNLRERQLNLIDAFPIDLY